MKNKLFFSAAIATIFAVSLVIGFQSSAKNLSFEENFFAGGEKKEMGDSGAYSFDKAHSSIGFRVRHMGLVDVPGYFRDFDGTINYDAKDVTKSTVEFTAKMTSVDTGVAGRDKHLRSADFFEVEKYADMTFKSTSVTKKGKVLTLNGELTMKGVKKAVSFPINITGFVKDQRGTMKMGVTAETVINRRDFGVNYGGNMPNGVAMLSDNITVVFQIEGNLPPAKK
ncbi:MAG: YceI family protein [Acidobacteria bacterium]|nr:YceI family protein [Acidobacteriota bacterium]